MFGCSSSLAVKNGPLRESGAAETTNVAEPRLNPYLAFSVPAMGNAGLSCLGVFELAAAIEPLRGPRPRRRGYLYGCDILIGAEGTRTCGLTTKRVSAIAGRSQSCRAPRWRGALRGSKAIDALKKQGCRQLNTAICY